MLLSLAIWVQNLEFFSYLRSSGEAFPTILAGIRIATVTTIGTATIAAAIGGGGLGTFVFRGIAMADTKTILAGAVPAALMAIAADEALGWIERRYSS